MPNSVGSPSTRRTAVRPRKQIGQDVISTGPPNSSLTISCHQTTEIGYVRGNCPVMSLRAPFPLRNRAIRPAVFALVTEIDVGLRDVTDVLHCYFVVNLSSVFVSSKVRVVLPQELELEVLLLVL